MLFFIFPLFLYKESLDTRMYPFITRITVHYSDDSLFLGFPQLLWLVENFLALSIGNSI